MKISENDMKVVFFFDFFFFVGSPSLLSVQSDWLLFPNGSLPFWLPERGAASLRCRWALCGVAVMMQVDQFKFGDLTTGFRMLRSRPLGGAMPFAAFPEKADTLGKKEGSVNRSESHNQSDKTSLLIPVSSL